ncbi:MAG: adenine phosphoribosyltransferase [candidate division Zixibacteria bacterium]|nr:adenine phosphoribosyltransferase [candidate division Zixibacteria bacterium]
MHKFAKLIRDIPDFPKKGIVFKDISTLIKDGPAFSEVTEIFFEQLKNQKVDSVVAIESRGFIFGGALANKLKCGLIPVRKKGKLPWFTEKEEYELEYGTDSLHIHKDALKRGENVVIVDDLLATGGTIGATCRLVEKLGGKVGKILVLVELAFIPAREKLKNYDLFSIVKYE